MTTRGQSRSFTGHHALLPASHPTLLARTAQHVIDIPLLAPRTFLSWTFGRGSVIWRIWPAVLLHTVVAAVVTALTLYTKFDLTIPGVLMTVLGMVIGFVISYRASSGYDRYWMGRTCWTDVIRNSRTMSRLIWIHVPLLLTPAQSSPQEAKNELDAKDVKRLMKEKREALDLIVAFSIAVKHHLRDEVGLYYEDLYHLIPSMHTHAHAHKHALINTTRPNPPIQADECLSPESQTEDDPTSKGKHTVPISNIPDPIVPPINAYGTFAPQSSSALTASQKTLTNKRSFSSQSSASSDSECQEHTALLPSSAKADNGVFSKVSSGLIPFAHTFAYLRARFRFRRISLDVETADEEQGNEGGVQRLWRPQIYEGEGDDIITIKRGAGGKGHRPRVLGGAEGENLPLDILKMLSAWCAVLEGRGVVPGTSLGPMLGCIAAFEDSLCSLEKILTTPLPFVYSVHINTVWIYLFFLPFQLVDQFKWATVLGTCIAAFIYLGFMAAGEEIEQPFGYDENDLDLDLLCHEVIRSDVERLKSMPCPNVFLGHLSNTTSDEGVLNAFKKPNKHEHPDGHREPVA